MPSVKKPLSPRTKILRIFLFILTVAFVILIWSLRGHFAAFEKLGLLGLFFINFISSASVLLPLPGTLTVFFGGNIWSPFSVGLVAAVGSTFGEISGYLVGYGGSGFMNQTPESLKRLTWMKKFLHAHGVLAIAAMAFIPMPFFDVAGIVAGAIGYPAWKFLLATFLGRVIRDVLLALVGAKFLPG